MDSHELAVLDRVAERRVLHEAFIASHPEYVYPAPAPAPLRPVSAEDCDAMDEMCLFADEVQS